MPIPALTAKGCLPPGVHSCTLAEVRFRFGAFAESDRRVQLFAKLESFVRELQRSGLFVAVIVDGSFVTAKTSPEDVDLIVLLRAGHDWLRDLDPAEYNLVSRGSLRRRFGFDVLVASDGDPVCTGYVEFFSRVREDASVRKGMLRIAL